MSFLIINDMNYKIISVNDNLYIFDSNDFEIIKLNTDSENRIESIINSKVNHEINKTQLFNGTNTFTKRNLKIITLDFANGCTLRCNYCFASAFKKEKSNLSKDLFLDILNFLEDIKTNHLIFYLTGLGEPTLNKDLLIELPNICKDKGFNNCSFEMTTNGTLIDKEMASFFKTNNFTIAVSLDGDEQSNRNRVFPNGKNSFEIVFNKINILKENNVDYYCKTVLDPSNDNLLAPFLFFESNRIPFMFGFVTDSFDKHITPTTDSLNLFEESLKKVETYYERIINVNQKIYSMKIINDLLRIHYGLTANYACVATIEGVYIDMNGGIFPCSYNSSSKELNIGNIYDDIDYQKAIDLGYYSKHVDSYKDCSSCWIKYLCSGSCFAIKWLVNNRTDIVSKYLCNIYKMYWEMIIRLYIKTYRSLIAYYV